MAERRSSAHADVDQNDGGTLKQRRIKKVESLRRFSVVVLIL